MRCCGWVAAVALVRVAVAHNGWFVAVTLRCYPLHSICVPGWRQWRGGCVACIAHGVWCNAVFACTVLAYTYIVVRSLLRCNSPCMVVRGARQCSQSRRFFLLWWYIQLWCGLLFAARWYVVQGSVRMHSACLYCGGTYIVVRSLVRRRSGGPAIVRQRCRVADPSCGTLEIAVASSLVRRRPPPFGVNTRTVSAATCCDRMHLDLGLLLVSATMCTVANYPSNHR